MTNKAKTPLVFLVGIFIFCVSAAAWAYGDCYRDCMDASGCWSVSPGTSASYCSGVQARCSSDCRDSGPAGRGKVYGAIAYSKKNGAYGYSHGWASQEKAEKVALKNCSENGKGCKSVVWFYNSCASVASDGRRVTWAQAQTAREAKKKALDKCNSAFFKGKCEEVVTHCSGN